MLAWVKDAAAGLGLLAFAVLSFALATMVQAVIMPV